MANMLSTLDNPTRLSNAHQFAALGDDIHVWLIDLNDDNDLSLAGLLSDEKQRALRFIQDRHRERFIVCHRWQTRVLAHYLGVSTSALTYQFGEQGKPALLVEGSPSALSFNLSHSNDAALLAVAVNLELGADIEYCKPGVNALEIADRFFTPKESAWLQAHAQDEVTDAFMTLWVRKESIIKALGTGLSQGLNTFECGAGQMVSEHFIARPDEAPRPYRCVSLEAPSRYKSALTYYIGTPGNAGANPNQNPDLAADQTNRTILQYRLSCTG